jgi:Predicted membrane protein
MLVAFPIALWVTGFIFDLLGTRGSNAGLWAAGFYCVIAGCVGAVLSAAAGVIDFLYTVPPESSAKNRGLLHGGLNSLVPVALYLCGVPAGFAFSSAGWRNSTADGNRCGDTGNLRMAGRHAGLSQPDWD